MVAHLNDHKRPQMTDDDTVSSVSASPTQQNSKD